MSHVPTETSPRGLTVQPNAVALAHAAEAELGFRLRWTTYRPGHQPSHDLALDVWGTDDQLRRLSEWVIANARRFGVWYQIRGARVGKVRGPGGQIWNPAISDDWREMEDRGTPTANHDGHNHISLRPEEIPMPHDHSFEEWARPHLEAVAENLRLHNAEMRERLKAQDEVLATTVETLATVTGAVERILDRLDQIDGGTPSGEVDVTAQLSGRLRIAEFRRDQ